MTTQRGAQSDIERKATAEDVRHVLGAVEDTLVAQILSHRPSLRELTDAALWVRGDGDLIAREHRELSAAASTIAEIMTREEDEQAGEGG